MNAPSTDFRPIPAAQIERMIDRALELGAAKGTDEAVKAIFLLHCELKDAEEALPPVVQEAKK